MINFDFTDFNLSEGVYDLISAGGGFSLNGAPDGDLSTDFGIIGLDPERFSLHKLRRNAFATCGGSRTGRGGNVIRRPCARLDPFPPPQVTDTAQSFPVGLSPNAKARASGALCRADIYSRKLFCQ